MRPVREQWWDTCVRRHQAPYYSSRAKALSAEEKVSNQRVKSDTASGYFIWGDRVRVISGDPSADRVIRVAGRGSEHWIRSRHLGGEPLLELYVIDVGQGDGLLLVSPEGHHILVDGGNTRSFQNAGKNAADFVDWKFFKDYLNYSDRSNEEMTAIVLDAVIASHNDIDHFGGILDLLDLQRPANDAELDSTSVRVENFYHAGLSWWYDGRTSSGKKKRTLGQPTNGFYTKLLNDRESAIAGTANLQDPDRSTLAGAWGRCIDAVVNCKSASDPNRPTNIERLTTSSHEWLPGFEPASQSSSISIRVLGPISEHVGNVVGLKRFPDGPSKNTNGHSVVLRVDYGARRLLLTGDLNTHAQTYIMEQMGSTQFANEYSCDVAKGCHHGSRDVSFRFLAGLKPVATVISSGDTESHDHPRPTIVAASAITGRKLLDTSGESLIMPLVFMTEVLRSYSIGEVKELHEFNRPQPEISFDKPQGDKKIHNTDRERSHFRAFFKSFSKARNPNHWPRLDQTRVVDGLVYGLVNVRTDGETLFFASMEEKGNDWSITVLDGQQIEASSVELS